LRECSDLRRPQSTHGRDLARPALAAGSVAL
jgi:hypothetical protein